MFSQLVRRAEGGGRRHGGGIEGCGMLRMLKNAKMGL